MTNEVRVGPPVIVIPVEDGINFIGSVAGVNASVVIRDIDSPFLTLPGVRGCKFFSSWREELDYASCTGVINGISLYVGDTDNRVAVEIISTSIGEDPIEDSFIILGWEAAKCFFTWRSGNEQ